MAEKRKQPVKQKDGPWAVLLMIAAGLASGGLVIWLFRLPGQAVSGWSGLFWLLAAVVVAQYIQIVAHEGGHLLFGLLTGYRFLSFRIGSVVLIRQEGRLVFRRCRVRGTGGQCLLIPPAVDGTKGPYVLYNLGGVLLNLAVAGGALALLLLLRPAAPASYFLLFTILFGLLLAVSNGVPMRMSGIANDGYNALCLGRRPQARRALYAQLAVVGLAAQGVRMKDMPEELFDLGENPDWSDPILCTIAYMQVARLVDAQQFEQALALAEDYAARETGMLGLHRNELACEQIFCELMGPCRKEKLEQLNTRQVNRHIRATKRNNLSRCRLLYAWELLLNRDRPAAERQLELFEQLAPTHPYPGEVESERELLAVIKKKGACVA